MRKKESGRNFMYVLNNHKKIINFICEPTLCTSYKYIKPEKYEILSVVACDLQLTSNIFEDCFEDITVALLENQIVCTY